jgi:hypothetical protein
MEVLATGGEPRPVEPGPLVRAAMENAARWWPGVSA